MLAQQEAVAAMTRLQAGDRTGLEQLYDRYAAVLFAVARRIVGEASEAEDVLQQVWIQVWKGARRYDPARGTVVTWLLTLVRSRAIDRRRSREARQRAESAMPVTGTNAPDPADSVEAVDRHARVRRALGKIDTNQRRVLELAFFGGLSHSEIAREIDKPLGTVKTWARRGLLDLRARLKEVSP